MAVFAHQCAGYLQQRFPVGALICQGGSGPVYQSANNILRHRPFIENAGQQPLYLLAQNMAVRLKKLGSFGAERAIDNTLERRSLHPKAAAVPAAGLIPTFDTR